VGSKNLLSALRRSAKRFPDRTALVDPAGELSYAELTARAEAVGALVGAATDRARVALFLPTSSAFVAAFYGVLAAGRTVLPLNLLVGPETLQFVCEDAGVDLVLTISALAEKAEGLGARVLSLDRPDGAGSGKPPERAPEEDAVLLYTSGTTDRPKGVPLTHRNIGANLESFAAAFDFDENDVFLGVLPMFHTFALTTTLALPMSIGARTVCQPRFQPQAALELIERHGVTAVMSIASMYRLLMHAHEKEPREVGTVRWWVAGGEPLADELADRFERLFGASLLEGYGLTEAAPVVCVNRPGHRRRGTAGTAIPNVAVRVVDEEGRPLPVGAEGELQVRGENVMRGYFNRPEETKATLSPDGWLRTGDMARIDAEGFIKITGRKKELIIISGENVSPVEIENVLNAHEAVFESAVVAARDASRGEVPVAFVAPVEGAEADADAIRRWCRAHLPPYKVPRAVHVMDELPHGPTGKVLRRKCREMLGADGGLS
jgi:long-chain acyl-CoA synthetase